MEVFICTQIKQTYNVPLSCNMCTVRAKTMYQALQYHKQMMVLHPFRPSTDNETGLFIPTAVV